MRHKWVLYILICIAGMVIVSSCCKQRIGDISMIEDVAVKFDTIQPGGLTGSEMDTVLVKYKRFYLDSFKGWRSKYFFDTFYSNNQGGFIYHTFTADHIGLGLQRNINDTLTIIADKRQFTFCNAILNISHSGRCNEKSQIVKHEVQLNGVPFDLEKSDQKKGNISIVNGVFFVK